MYYEGITTHLKNFVETHLNLFWKASSDSFCDIPVIDISTKMEPFPHFVVELIETS